MLLHNLNIPHSKHIMNYKHNIEEKTIRIVQRSISTIMADIFPASVTNPDPYPISGVYLPRSLFNTHAITTTHMLVPPVHQILSHLCQRYCIMRAFHFLYYTYMCIFVLSPCSIFSIKSKMATCYYPRLKIHSTVNKLKYK